MKNVKSLLFLALLFTLTNLNAQITGTVSVPGTYSDLAAAFSALNAQGVGSGGATININATQTCPLNGFQLGSATLNASLSAANPLIINGNSNAITAYAGTRAGSITSGVNDGMIILNGVDYVTINNIIFNELATNTTAALAMEHGIGMYNRTATVGAADGCKYVTISGCTFNLSNVSGPGMAINAAPYVWDNATVIAWEGTSEVDIHRSITINNNNFANIFSGVQFRGATSRPGKALVVTNNTFTGIGGGSGNTAYGTNVIYLDSVIYTNNISTGDLTHSTTSYHFNGITNVGGFIKLNNNTLTLQNNVTTSATYGIYNTSIGGNREINNNTLNFGSFPSMTSGLIYGLYGSYSGGNNNITLQMNNNVISNQTIPSTTSTTIYLMYNTASVGTNRVIEMNGNTITNLTKASSGTITCMYVGTANSAYAKNNVINNILNTNNSVSGTSVIRGIYGFGSPTYMDVSNNTISNISIVGVSTSTTGTIRGIESNTASTGTADVYQNTIHDLSFNVGTTTGTVSAIYGATNSSNFYKNNIYNLSAAQASGLVKGIELVSAPTFNIYNNFISGLTTPQSNSNIAVSGIHVSGTSASASNISYNTIYPSSAGPLTSTAALFGAAGIYYSSTATNITTLKNNIVNISGTANGDAYIAAVKRVAVGTAGTKPTNFFATNNVYNAPYVYGEGPTLSSATNVYYVVGGTVGTADPSFNTSCGLYKVFMGETGTFYENNLTSVGTGLYVPSGLSFAQMNATTITNPTITDDYNSIARGAFPDCGALEFTGPFNDATPPTVSYTPLSNTICTNSVTLSATIADPSGVNNSAGTKPRLYFKKSTDSNILAATNTAASDGWKYVEASNTTSPFTFTINFSIIFGGSVASGDIINYFVTAQDLAAVPNVSSNQATYPSGFCPNTVALQSAAFPVMGFLSFDIIGSPTSIATSASNTTLCISGSVILSLTGGSAIGAQYQWQSSPAGANNWTNIAGATNITYTASPLTASTDFRCIITCDGVPISASPSTPVSVTVNSPQILSTTPAVSCTPGPISLSLSATSSAGSTISWYENPTGGNSIGTGSPFITPMITNTTTYYVSAGQGISNYQGALPNQVAIPGSGYTLEAGLFFNALTGFVLEGVYVYPIGTGAGSVVIALQDGSVSPAVTLQSLTVNLTGTASPYTKTFVPLNFNVPVGSNYKLMMMSRSGLVASLVRESGTAWGTYPITTPGVLSVTNGNCCSGNTTSTSYYYFYDWQVRVGCESERVPVTASIITSNPTCPANMTVCLANPAFTLTGASPEGGVYSGTGVIGTQFSPAAAGVGTHTITYTVCGLTCTFNITVTQASPTIQFTENSGAAPNDGVVCAGASATLTATSSSSYAWSNGATTQSITVSTAGTYTVTVTNSLGCVGSTSATVTTSPAPTSSFSVVQPTTCISTNGSIDLTITTPGTYTYIWSNGATTQDLTGVAVGDYVVTVTDQYTCTHILMQSLIGPGGCTLCPTLPTTITIAPTPACVNGNFTMTENGMANLGVTYGIAFKRYNSVVADPYTAVGGTILTTVSNAGLTNLGSTAVGTGSIPSSGTFYIYAILDPTHPDPACRPYSSATLNVNSLPTAGITIAETSGTTNNDGIICQGASATLTGTGGTSYVWSTGASTTSITVNTAGTYTVTVTSATGCTASSSRIITVNPVTTPVNAITESSGTTANDGNICQGSSATITCVSMGTYAWSTGATTSSITVNTSGTYTVSLTNSNGCVGTASTVITVNPLPIPAIAVTENSGTANDGTIIEGSSATLTASGGLSYRWNTNATTPSITVSPLVTTTYTVTVTNANGCTASASRAIVVIPPPCHIVCAGDQNVTLAPGACEFAIPNLVTFVDQCDVYTIVQTAGPTAGTNVGPGSYTLKFELRRKNNGMVVDDCELTLTVAGISNPIASLACKNHVNISIDNNCLVTLNADMFLEGGPYACYWDYQINILPFNNQANAMIDVAQGVGINLPLGNHTFEIIGFDGNKCWGTFTVEDKLPPVLSCNCVDDPVETVLTNLNGTIDVNGPKLEVSTIAGACTKTTTANRQMPFALIVPFTVTTAGSITFAVNATLNTSFPFSVNSNLGYQYIYSDLPNPTDLCDNYVYAQSFSTTGTWTPTATQLASIGGQFVPGVTYYYVLASYYITNILNYNINFTHNGGGQLISIQNPANAKECQFKCYDIEVVKRETVAMLLGSSTNKSKLTTPISFSDCGSVTAVFKDRIYPTDCDKTKLVRDWTVTDAKGNSAVCSQTFTFHPLKLDSLTPPAAEVYLSCGLETSPAAISGYLDIDSRTGTLSATNIGAFADDWSATPSVVELNEGYEYGYYTYQQIGFDGKMHAQKVDMNICNIYTSFSDVNYPVCGLGCGGNMKVVRTWKLLDWCTREVREYYQIIKAVDQKAPTFTAKDVTVSVDPWECQANYKVEKPWELEDNCAKTDEIVWGVNVAPGLTVSGTRPNFTISGLEKGVHDIVYWAQDCCGNYSELSATVTVVDATGPIPVAKQNIVLSLTGSGNGADGAGKLYGWQVDNGSYDQCSDVRFEVRRVDGGSCGNVGANGTHNNNSTYNDNNGYPSEVPDAVWFHPMDNAQDTDGGEFVKFCCEDIPAGADHGLHDVEMRVWDDGNMNGIYGDNDIIDGMKDNYNTTWVTIRVENKLPPTLICPKDVTVTCDMELNLSEGVDTKVSDVNLTMTGYPKAYDLCSNLDVTYSDQWVGTHDPVCKSGTIRRTFKVTKGSVVVTCTQFITVTTITVPFTVTFPNQNGTTEWDKCSFSLEDARDAANASIKRPIVNYGQCDIVGENITIDTFLFEDGACKKWRVKYSYKNWCTGEEINTIAGLPIVHWYAFKDVTAPVLSCSNQMFAANPNPLNPNGGCEASVALEASASDALICAEESWIKWQMFFDGWNNGTVDRLGSSFVNKSWNGIWVPQAKYIAGVLNPTWVALQNQHPNLPLADLVYVTYIKPTKASGETVKLPVGTGATAFILNAENINHKVLWKVTDGCGNVDQCESTVMVVDKKAPTPYCVSVSTALMQTSPEMVELWARDFDKGAFDNCSPQSKLFFTFDGAAPIYSRVNEEHYYKVVGGVSVNATATEYAQGKAYRWLPASRSAGKVWTVSGDYELQVDVWDEAWNTDYCKVDLKIRTKSEGSRVVAGNVSTMFGTPMSGVNILVDANLPEYPKTYTTDQNGNYGDAHQIDFDYSLTSDFNGDYLNGVSTLDMVMVQRHILGSQTFDLKYKYIAADANNDGKVTASDLTDLRKLILGISTRLPNKSWRFPLKDAEVKLSPLEFDEDNEIYSLAIDHLNEDVVAVKVGDVNGSAVVSINGTVVEPRSAQNLNLVVNAKNVDKGEVVEIPVYSSNFSAVSGFQYTMNLKGASFVGINGGAIEMNASNVGVLTGDVLTMSYANDEAVSANEGDVLFTLVVKADQATNVSEILSLTSDVTRAESYNGDLKVGGVSLSVRTAPVASIELFQNEPNPFKGQTTIMFTMPEAATATLSVHDVTGKVVAVRNISAMRGQNSEVFTKDQLGVSGVLYYTLKSGDFTATKKMIIVE